MSKEKPDKDSNAHVPSDDTATLSRNNRTGSKTSGEKAQRRRPNDPGRYPERDDQSIEREREEDTTGPYASRKNTNMETAFDDEDIADEGPVDKGADEGDGDIDWDDSMPARGGGKRPDE